MGLFPKVVISPDDSNPKNVTCVFCDAQVTTIVSKKLKILLTIICLLISPILFLILYCTGIMRYNLHKCPNCQGVVSKYPELTCQKN